MKLYLNDVELADDKVSIKDSGILAAAEPAPKLEVEIFIKVSIEVQGKGKDYSVTVEVQPSEEIEVLKTKVSFFKIFV